MGLDMYLRGSRYLFAYGSDEDQTLSRDIQNLFPELADLQGRSDKSVIKEIEIEAGYWRKANHIHKWFVEHVQDGEDDCETYHVSREQLTNLLELCQRVLGFRHLANELLPTQEGFFFGSTSYDDGYYQDIEHTIQVLEDALKLPESWSFQYQSSW